MKAIKLFSITMAIIAISCQSNEKVKEADKIKLGMHKSLVDSVLGEPERCSVLARGEQEVVTCKYDLDHPFDYRFRVSFDTDSLCVYKSWE